MKNRLWFFALPDGKRLCMVNSTRFHAILVQLRLSLVCYHAAGFAGQGL